MDIAPIFQTKPIWLDGARKMDRIKTKASELLEQIDSIHISNENALMLNQAKLRLEEVIFWAVKALSREPVPHKKEVHEDDF